MRRVSEPLSRFGAAFHGRADGRLPVTVVGTGLRRCRCATKLPVASAQVKSAVLLAGLNTPGETVVVEPSRRRADHTERMLRHFGACVQQEDGGVVRLAGEPELVAQAPSRYPETFPRRRSRLRLPPSCRTRA